MIFINYRSMDSNVLVTMLERELKRQFGGDAVFRDKSGIEGGDRWRAEIQQHVTSCTVMLVAIGEKWETTTFESGKFKLLPRLYDKDDCVRLEIIQAFRDRKHVIPILLDTAQMPDKEWLANFDLQDLHEVQWCRLDTNHFQRDFESLIDLLTQKTTLLSQARSSRTSLLPVSPESFLQMLRAKTSFIDIRGLSIGTGKAHRFPIDDLYIHLNSRMSAFEWREVEHRFVQSADPRGVTQSVGAVVPPLRSDTSSGLVEVPLRYAMTLPRLVIIGDPGSGKTTFLRRLASELCSIELGLRSASPTGWIDPLGRTFPIYLSCAKLANHIAANLGLVGAPSDQTSPSWLAHCLAAESRENCTGLDQDFFQRQLEAGQLRHETRGTAEWTLAETGRTTVMFDGLDEAPDQQQRTMISQLVENAASVFNGCRFVVTSRPPAYTGKAVLPMFSHVEIAPLSNEAVEAFLKNWCLHLYTANAAEAESHFWELVTSMQQRPEIRQMACNPVMLTALAVVHWNERRLPERRVDLYESVITWLSRSRENRPGRERPEQTVRLLQTLALAMHSHPTGRQTQVTKRWAAEHVLGAYFGGQVATSLSIEAAERFLTDEELDSGIIVAAGNNIRFWHLQFQEFLAARAIASLPERDQRAYFIGRSCKAYHPEWRETILLLAGTLFNQGEDKVTTLIRDIIDELPNEQSGLGDEYVLAEEARCVGLLGVIFRDLAAAGYHNKEHRYRRILAHVMVIFDVDKAEHIAVGVRIAAAEALGQVGDPRLMWDPQRRWIEIGESTFLMGAQNSDWSAQNYDRDAADDEAPVRRVTVNAFTIGRYAVTVSEFQLFVEHRGYSTCKYWNEGGGFTLFDQPENWASQLEFPNRPVCGLSWYEAMAYCSWAGVRLPCEAEWERAARDSSSVVTSSAEQITGHPYPWGKRPADSGRLNFGRHNANPTPVGIYPSGATPSGIYDLAGNVWEWCSDWYDLYSGEEINPRGPVSGKWRVLRGGSWFDVAERCRSSARAKNSPDLRSMTVGFRVVRKS